MARKYLFICDACGRTEPQDSEALPKGWAIVVSNIGANDLCSRECSNRALDIAEQVGSLNPAGVAPLLTANGQG